MVDAKYDHVVVWPRLINEDIRQFRHRSFPRVWHATKTANLRKVTKPIGLNKNVSDNAFCRYPIVALNEGVERCNMRERINRKAHAHKRQIRALTNVIAMLIDEESRHYLETRKPKKHIFKDLMALADYLQAPNQEGAACP